MSHEALLSGNRSMCTVAVEGYRRKDGEDMNPDQLWIGPGFFETMGIPLAAGRDFSARDGLGAPRVAIINSTMARYFFGNANPLGRRIGLGHEQPGIEIVGVVGDTKISDLREKPRRAFYLPYMQDKEVGGLHVYVRTAADPGAMAAVLRREVRNLDSGIPVIGLRSMRVQIDRLLLLERIVAGLSLAFGLLATLLAAVGLYGVMAYTVVRRTREIGIRVALGATRNTVLGLVLREAGQLAAIGIAIALPASYALSRLMRSLLYGLAPADPATLIAATLITAAVVLAASGIPARRATRIDPLTALRYE
jgi:predicted permease